MKDRIRNTLEVIWMVICILGVMWIVWDYVQRENETDRLIREHLKEAKR
jgi:hypothetical protein